MPIERSPTAPLPGIAPRSDGVRVARLARYPVNAFVLESTNGDVGALADAITAAALKLQAANQPHNMLISDCGGRVFLVPQCYAEKQAKGVVPEHLLATGEGRWVALLFVMMNGIGWVGGRLRLLCLLSWAF